MRETMLPPAARRRSRVRSYAAAALAAALVIGCGDDDSTGPTMEAVAGTYVATTFTTTVLGTTTDQLARGGLIDLTLAADGTTSGRLFVPDTDGSGTAIDQSLAGTWTLSGNIVQFSSSNDTFLRDVPLTVQGERLVGTGTFQGVIVSVVLERPTQ